nr:reverse transcriptase domain-containing protein [Tanacetum cinerariifolium]
RSRADRTLLNDFEMATEGNGDPPVPDLRTMEELYQPSLNGRVQNSCQFHALLGNDANKHLDKFLHVTQSIKVNGVTDDALRLYLFPHSVTHHATAWFDRLPMNSINTFEQMAKIFLGKYFPPSMVTKIRNEITNFRQRPDESLSEAREHYKLSIDRCPNHNMFPVTQIDTFCNGLTLGHRDTINASAGGTFMKRRPEECYDLIENMTAHHNDWDTLAQRSKLYSSITSSSDPEITSLKAKMKEINKNLMRVLQVNQQVKAVTHNCETCSGPHSYNDCPATVGQTQKLYATRAYQGGNSCQPQGNRNMLSYRLDNYLGPPGFNQNQNRNNQNQNFQNQNKNHGIPQGNNQGRNQFFQGANHGQNPPPAYQEPAYQATGYQASANAAILKNMQTNMTSLKNSNLELKYMFGQFMKMNTTSSSGSETLLGNTITNLKEDLKGITTRSGTAYQGPTIPTTSSSLPKVVECETEAITFNLDQTLRYLANYNDMMENRIDVIDMDCEEYSQEVIEVDAFLALEDYPTSSEVDQSYFDPDRDILLLEAFLNDDPSLPPPNQANYFPQVELKDLPPHLEYAFLEVDDKLLIIIAKDLSDEEKTALITVLRSHKRAITWELSDIKGINPKFCTHKILMEDDFEPTVQHQRRVNLKIHDIIKKVVLKLLDAGLIYPISDSLWVSPVHCVPKKGGITVFKNEDNELISTRLVTGWREKSHFMVKEGIILSHKISKNGIEVDKDKVDVIAKLPHPTTVKGIHSFLSHAGFYRRFIQDFSKTARPMTRLLEKDTLFFFSKEVVEAFQTLKRKLTEAPILIALDWDYPLSLCAMQATLSSVWSWGNVKKNILGLYNMLVKQ